MSKPLALVHFGPKKTATSTIQETLREKSAVLRKNHGVHLYWTPGRPSGTPGHYIRHCLDLESHLCEPEDRLAWDAFTTTIQSRAYKNANNETAIFTMEFMARLTEPQYKTLDLFEDIFAGYDTRVALTYRHFPEWYLSEYNQEQKQRQNLNNLVILGFVDWHRDSTDYRKFEQLSILSSWHVKEYQRRFGQFVVFNMHQVTNSSLLVEDWLCHCLPEHCQWAREEQILRVPLSKAARNPSKDDLEARRLAQLVLSRGGFTPSRLLDIKPEKLRDLTKRIKTWLDNPPEDTLIPRTCLTPEEELDIWRMTLQRRDDLVPGYDPKNLLLKENFEKVRKKFCQVDFHGLLKMPSWNELVRDEWISKAARGD